MLLPNLLLELQSKNTGIVVIIATSSGGVI